MRYNKVESVQSMSSSLFCKGKEDSKKYSKGGTRMKDMKKKLAIPVILIALFAIFKAVKKNKRKHKK